MLRPKRRLRKPTPLEHGVLYAAALFQLTHDQPAMVADILRQAGLTTAHCGELEECDREALRKVNREKGMALTGLD